MLASIRQGSLFLRALLGPVLQTHRAGRCFPEQRADLVVEHLCCRHVFFPFELVG